MTGHQFGVDPSEIMTSRKTQEKEKIALRKRRCDNHYQARFKYLNYQLIRNLFQLALSVQQVPWHEITDIITFYFIHNLRITLNMQKQMILCYAMIQIAKS